MSIQHTVFLTREEAQDVWRHRKLDLYEEKLKRQVIAFDNDRLEAVLNKNNTNEFVNYRIGEDPSGE